MRFSPIFVALMLWSSIASAKAPVVSANAVVSNEEVEVGQTFSYQIDVTVQGNQEIKVLSLPDFSDFKTSPPVRSPRLININGNIQRGLVTQFRLLAKKPGTYKLSAPQVQVGNQKLKLNDVTIRVAKAGTLPKKRSKVTKSSRYLLEPTVSPQKPYVGEQITLRYWLYSEGFSLDVSPRPPDEPELNEFWIEDQSHLQPNSGRRVQKNGRIFRETPIRSYALFPLRSGSITIEPMEMDINVGGMFRSKEIRIASAPVTLEVKPLPPDAPEGFYEGNVGQWSFKSSVSATETTVGEPIELRLTIAGFGQAGRLKLPNLPPLAGAKTAEPSETTASPKRALGKVEATRTKTFTITPTEAGTLQIPSVRFAFFNPTEEAYQTAESKPFEIKVGPGTLRDVAPIEQVENDRGSTDDLVRDLREQLNRDDTPSRIPTQIPFAIWWLLSALVVGATIFPTVRRRWLEAQAERSASRSAQPGHATIAAIDDGAPLDAIFKSFSKQDLGLSLGSLSAQKIRDSVAERTDEATGDLLGDAYASLQNARYNPSGVENVDRAAVVAAIRKVIATLAVLLFFAPATARGESGPTIEQLHESAHDAAAWYQYGTAAAAAEDYADGRWALENARLRAPFFREAADNLDIVEQIVRIKSVEASRTGRTLEGDETLFWWRFFTSVPSWFFGLAMVLSWCAVFACVSGLRRYRESSARRDALVVALVASLTAAAVATTLSAVKGSVVNSTTPVVIRPAQIELREGPSKLAKRVRTDPNIVPGVVVRMIEVRPKWVKLEFPDGRVAWTAPDAVLKVSLDAPFNSK